MFKTWRATWKNLDNVCNILSAQYFLHSTTKDSIRAALKITPLVCFIMSARNIRDRCWWHGRRAWMFPPVSHYILLLCNRWQQRGGLTKWPLIWKGRRSKGVSLSSSMQKKWHPFTFMKTCWMFMETQQCKWAQSGGGWCISAVMTTMWKTSYEYGMQALVHCWQKNA